jgi:PAS domain S-box-containing protein
MSQNNNNKQPGKKLSGGKTKTATTDSGKPIAIATTERDINEQNNIEQVRLQSQRLLAMVEHLPVGAIYVSGERLTLNREAEKITGFDRSELDSLEHWFKKLYGKRSKKIRRLYEKDRAAGFPKRTIPITIVRKDGDERFVDFAAYRFDNHEVWLMYDITERVADEIALKSSEERLRSIMDNASESIIVIDETGLITDYNLAAETMFGYSAAETLGHNISMLMPSPYREQHDAYLQKYLRTGISNIMNEPRELPAQRKDGSIFMIQLSVNQVADIGLFCGIMRDLTQQKQLEKEVANISAMEQDRLGKDIHDGLGQQLTGLNMMISSLQREMIRENIPQSEKLDEIIHYLQKATLYARALSRGLAPLSIEKQGLVEAITVLATDIKNTTGINCQLDLTMTTDIEDEAINIQIYRIIQESVNNAVKHADAENIRIKLRNAYDFVLKVSDDGKGFDVSDKAYSSNHGLRIMRYRAGIIGCELKIESTPGKGTCVKCTAPQKAQ